MFMHTVLYVYILFIKNSRIFLITSVCYIFWLEGSWFASLNLGFTLFVLDVSSISKYIEGLPPYYTDKVIILCVMNIEMPHLFYNHSIITYIDNLYLGMYIVSHF